MGLSLASLRFTSLQDMFGYALRHPRLPAKNGIINVTGLTPLTLACKLGRAEVSYPKKDIYRFYNWKILKRSRSNFQFGTFNVVFSICRYFVRCWSCHHASSGGTVI